MMPERVKFKAFTTEKRDYVFSAEWDDHKEFILSKVAVKTSQKEIIAALKVEKGVSIKLPQLKRLLGEWGASRRNLNAKQRNLVWTVSQERKAEGKLSTVFQFKSDGRVVPNTQINAALKWGEEEFPSYQDKDDRSPGLIYSTPIAMGGGSGASTHGPVENADSPTEAAAVSAVGNTTDGNAIGLAELTPEPNTKESNNRNSEPSRESQQTIESPREIPEKPNETFESLEPICQEIVDSVNSTYASVLGSRDAVRPKEGRRKDYSADFATELEERIAATKRAAKLFLQDMSEEAARCGETLSVAECYSRVRACWVEKPKVPHTMITVSGDPEPLPYAVYRQLDQLNRRERVQSPDQPDVSSWKEIRAFYTEHLDEVASICLSYPMSHYTHWQFRYQAAHFLTLAKRFGVGHHLTIQSITTFTTVVLGYARRDLPIQIPYRILQNLQSLGMQLHEEFIRLVQITFRMIRRQILSGRNENRQYLIPISKLWFRVAELRIQRGFSPMKSICEKYHAMTMVGCAYKLNGEKEKGLKFERHAKIGMSRVQTPDGANEWACYALAWFAIGVANIDDGSLTEAKSSYQSAYEAFRQARSISKASPTTDNEFICLNNLGATYYRAGEYKAAIEKQKAFIDFRSAYYGVKDTLYLQGINRIARYMEKRGLVYYSQPILQLTIEMCEAAGIDGDDFHALVARYYRTAFSQDMIWFKESTYGLQTWNDPLEVD
ncbi:hypothetical protein TWF281_009566 [Arthrobotrys megalospora]